MNNELVKELNGKTYHFKLKSKKLIDLEKVSGKSIIDLLQDTSISNIARILKYSCIEEVDEFELLDMLLETMTLEKIITDVILEICVVSGIISKTDKENVDKKLDEEKNQ